MRLQKYLGAPRCVQGGVDQPGFFLEGQMSSDSNELQNAQAAKLTAHQHAKAIEDATYAVETALNPFADADRKRVLDSALGNLKSNLAVFLGGG
jgi:hypothetical protein